MKKLIIPILAGLFVASLVWSAYAIAPWQGGTGQDTSGWTGLIRTDSGVWSTTTVAAGLWTDSGDFTYLIATSDDIVMGASATSSAPFWIDVSTGDLTVAGNISTNKTSFGFTFNDAEGTLGIADYNADGDTLYLYAESAIPVFLYGSTPGYGASLDISALSADRTFYFPNLTGTFLMATGTQNIDTSGTLTITGVSTLATTTIAGPFAIDSSGNVTSGTWQGTIIAHEYGGIETNISAVKKGELLIGTSAGTIGLFATGTDDYVLTASSSATGGAIWAEAAAGVAGATIELDNLGVVAINTSLISDTDSTDDLGSSAKYWANTYTDKVFLSSSVGIAAFGNYLRISPGFGVQAGYWTMNGTVGLDMANTAASEPLLRGMGTKDIVIRDVDFKPWNDSVSDLGTSAEYWDETYTDELLLTNVGAQSAAADKLVLSAIDYSAGHTILDINTEGTEVVTTTADVAASKLLRIRINGTVYEILVK